jgi:dipeptidyl-peptidase-4
MISRAWKNLPVGALAAVLASAAVFPGALPSQQAPRKALTVERIYGDPALGGSLAVGQAWSPDGSLLTYMDLTPHAWQFAAIDMANGQRRAIIPTEKFTELLIGTRAGIIPLPAEAGTQATGLGRHAPPSYLWSPRGDLLVFSLHDGLLAYDLKKQEPRTLLPSGKPLSDVKFSPDGRMVSFVRDHSIHVVAVEGGEEHNVTGAGSEELRRGELDWVYPEELGCRTAYWWSPDSTQIAFYEMDERHVAFYPMISFQGLDAVVQPERYPRAGTNNPVVRVGVVDVAPEKEPRPPRWMDTGAEKNIYLPRVEWLPDSKQVIIQRLNRAQNQLDLLLADAASGRSDTILRENDPYWVNVTTDPVFLDAGKRFLWTSERDGFRHIYLYSSDGKLERQLTKGDWEVTEIAGADEKAGAVYFVATEKSPLEHHLYRLPLAGGPPQRLTREDGTHGISMAPDAKHYLDTYSNVMTPPREDVYRADGSRLAVLTENVLPELADYGLVKPEFHTITGPSGAKLSTMMIRPPNFDASRKYPVLIYTYGGPGSQVVRNAWDPVPRRWQQFLWHQMMAQKGYIIFELDNRGSPARGHAFETAIFHHLGRVELEDQLAGVAYLKSLPYVNPARIGIWGWSYGGFMTLTAMLRAPDVFKAGFAGSPVTQWRLYDTIYTERYMGHPTSSQENSNNYKDSSPVTHAAGLQGKLLIAFGTGDDNVHFDNSMELQEAFIKAGRYAEFMFYPDRGHGISDSEARIHLFLHITQFFLDNL